MDPVCLAIRHARGLAIAPPGLCAQCRAAGKKLDLAAAARTTNIVASLTCPGCPRRPELDTVLAWERASGITDPPPEIINLPDRSIDYTTPVADVARNIAGPAPDRFKEGWPTPMARLETELPTGSVPSHVRTKISAADAVANGLTFEMIVATPEDWQTIFVHKYYSARQLASVGATFTRFVLAGLPLALFAAAAIDAPGLAILRFNRHAFDAAGGTPAQWTEIMKTARVPPEQEKQFGTEYRCPICRPLVK